MKKKRGIGRFLFALILGAAAVIGVIALCDSRRVFAQEEMNNHTGKSWHYLYKYAQAKMPVDVLILGNSHAYTGIQPAHMSRMMGKRCFILASQGNYATDAYYMLEEALSIVKPKMVIVETYLIRDYKQRELSPADLNCQFQSFENRRNVKMKLKSTPELFAVDDIPYAWSATLRNHSYIFENRALLKYNLQHPQAPEYKDKEYLGRFVRFMKGLSEETMERYRTEGAPVDGAKMTVSEDARNAVSRIKALCKQKRVKLMFLTIPMYHEHITNAEALRSNLDPLVGDYAWLFLQAQAFDSYFTPDCFEDTYGENQHQTAGGALKTTDVLVDFIDYSKLL